MMFRWTGREDSGGRVPTSRAAPVFIGGWAMLLKRIPLGGQHMVTLRVVLFAAVLGAILGSPVLAAVAYTITDLGSGTAAGNRIGNRIGTVY